MNDDAAITVWLLAFDGALNIDGPSPWPSGSEGLRRGVIEADGRDWPMRIATELLDAIRALHDTGTVEIRWASAWSSQTAKVSAWTGLPHFADAFAPDPRPELLPVQKRIAARRVIAEGHRLIWTDGAQVPAPGTQLHDELTADGRALLIAPDLMTGLTPQHLDAIRAFASLPRIGRDVTGAAR